jgi:hypothetical protein
MARQVPFRLMLVRPGMFATRGNGVAATVIETSELANSDPQAFPWCAHRNSRLTTSFSVE